MNSIKLKRLNKDKKKKISGGGTIMGTISFIVSVATVASIISDFIKEGDGGIHYQKNFNINNGIKLLEYSPKAENQITILS